MENEVKVEAKSVGLFKRAERWVATEMGNVPEEKGLGGNTRRSVSAMLSNLQAVTDHPKENIRQAVGVMGVNGAGLERQSRMSLV